MPQLYETILHQCQDQCELLIVSKHRSIAQIQAYYDRGARDFGENRAQELLQKAPQLPSDIRWNFIGHLQRNKVRAVLPYLHLSVRWIRWSWRPCWTRKPPASAGRSAC